MVVSELLPTKVRKPSKPPVASSIDPTTPASVGFVDLTATPFGMGKAEAVKPYRIRGETVVRILAIAERTGQKRG